MCDWRFRAWAAARSDTKGAHGRLIPWPDQRAERPDLASEVIWTSGGLDKLAIYARLEVPEVWIWRDEKLHIHVLRGTAYEQVQFSEQLPGIDLDQLLSFVDRPTAMQAVRAYRAALQG